MNVYSIVLVVLKSTRLNANNLPEFDGAGGARKRGEVRGVGALRQPVGNVQQRQERLDLGRSVRGSGRFTLADSGKA